MRPAAGVLAWELARSLHIGKGVASFGYCYSVRKNQRSTEEGPQPNRDAALGAARCTRLCDRRYGYTARLSATQSA